MLLLNGSIRGDGGNTGAALRVAARLAENSEVVELASYAGTVETLTEKVRAATHLIVGTGVYWGSWGSPLQRFLEVLTSEEATPVFLGKPLGIIVTMDSVGGSDVAHRIAGVFSTLGCLIPPLSSVVLSRLAHEAKAAPHNTDVWQTEDITTLVHHVTSTDWRSWPTKQTRRVTGPYPASGVLDLAVPRYL